MNNKYKILLVDSDKDSLSFVAGLLSKNGYQIIQAESLESAKIMHDSYMPDLIISELVLLDADGSSLLEYVRSNVLTPIIVLSSQTDEMQKVAAFDMGANDYITKPFGENELLARVRAALRNHRFCVNGAQLTSDEFSYNGLKINYDARRVFVKESEIKLTQTEFNIIAFLAIHFKKMMSYSDIVKAVWGGQADSGSVKKLQVNMANIRRKLCSKADDAEYISNEAGVGYRLG